MYPQRILSLSQGDFLTPPNHQEIQVFQLFGFPLKSGQIIIFHQPRFPWNKGISLTKPPFGVRSCEVAIIWPDWNSLPQGFRKKVGVRWVGWWGQILTEFPNHWAPNHSLEDGLPWRVHGYVVENYRDRKSPNWGYFPLNMAFLWLINGGYEPLTKWDNPPSSWQGFLDGTNMQLHTRLEKCTQCSSCLVACPSFFSSFSSLLLPLHLSDKLRSEWTFVSHLEPHHMLHALHNMCFRASACRNVSGTSFLSSNRCVILWL